MPGPDLRSPTPRGFTLLELVIVMAVLAVVAGLALPALRRPLSKSKVRDAAREVSVALARARLEAIRSGVAQQFRYQPGGSGYEVSAFSTTEQGGFTPVGPEGLEQGPANGALATAASAPQGAQQHELPGGVRFFDPLLPGVASGEPDPAARATSESWSAPIVFYPNGRTLSARIRLCGDYGYYVDVTLRGLTGATKAGLVLRLEQPPDASLGAIAEGLP